MEEIEEKIRVALCGEKLIVDRDADIEGLTSRGYGTMEGDTLHLEPYEGLYLLMKDVIEVRDEAKGIKVSFRDLLSFFHSLDESIWVRYMIYRDLRSRGYVIRGGFGPRIHFRVYERGSYGEKAATYLVFGIQEGIPISVNELARILKHAQNLKKKLILAVINRRGELVYYSLSRLTL